ncbi:MAG: hypothetical protein K8T91_03030 [Planctomycetes bacterium]|nr:hypothetical protein [Planctomycetota bacterium]
MGIDYPKILRAVQANERYQGNLDWGKARKGHPEGTVRSHIADLERNLHRLRRKLTDTENDKLRILIHTHDAFKAEATGGVPIRDSRSHASLARKFLAQYCSDDELLTIVQYHDEPYALWQRVVGGGTCDEQRLMELIGRIKQWDLFLAFLIIDGCNEGKTREPLYWFFEQIYGKVDSRFSREDILL